MSGKQSNVGRSTGRAPWFSPASILGAIGKGFRALRKGLERVPGFPTYDRLAQRIVTPVFNRVRLPAAFEARVEPFLEAQACRRIDPILVFPLWIIVACLGIYPSKLGHLDTTPFIYTILTIVSGFNPFLGLLSGGVFSVFDWIGKWLPFENVYGANYENGFQNYIGARLGYLFGYSIMLATGVFPGVMARVFRVFGKWLVNKILPKPAARAAAGILLLGAAAVLLGQIYGPSSLFMLIALAAMVTAQGAASGAKDESIGELVGLAFGALGGAFGAWGANRWATDVANYANFQAFREHPDISCQNVSEKNYGNMPYKRTGLASGLIPPGSGNVLTTKSGGGSLPTPAIAENMKNWVKGLFGPSDTPETPGGPVSAQVPDPTASGPGDSPEGWSEPQAVDFKPPELTPSEVIPQSSSSVSCPICGYAWYWKPPLVGGLLQIPGGCPRCAYKIGDDPNKYIPGQPATTDGKPLQPLQPTDFENLPDPDDPGVDISPHGTGVTGGGPGGDPATAVSQPGGPVEAEPEPWDPYATEGGEGQPTAGGEGGEGPPEPPESLGGEGGEGEPQPWDPYATEGGEGTPEPPESIGGEGGEGQPVEGGEGGEGGPQPWDPYATEGGEGQPTEGGEGGEGQPVEGGEGGEGQPTEGGEGPHPTEQSEVDNQEGKEGKVSDPNQEGGDSPSTQQGATPPAGTSTPPAAQPPIPPTTGPTEQVVYSGQPALELLEKMGLVEPVTVTTTDPATGQQTEQVVTGKDGNPVYKLTGKEPLGGNPTTIVTGRTTDLQGNVLEEEHVTVNTSIGGGWDTNPDGHITDVAIVVEQGVTPTSGPPAGTAPPTAGPAASGPPTSPPASSTPSPAGGAPPDSGQASSTGSTPDGATTSPEAIGEAVEAAMEGVSQGMEAVMQEISQNQEKLKLLRIATETYFSDNPIAQLGHDEIPKALAKELGVSEATAELLLNTARFLDL